MRLKLDLGEFVDDERKLSLLCVKTGDCMTVGDVIIKICQVFTVGPNEENSRSYAEVALFDDGFFIHPSQCSSVLEGGGILKLQWLLSQEVVKKKKKRTSIDDIEFIEVKRSNIKVENKTDFENIKVKRKKQGQEKESTQVKESDLESLKKKRKNKSQNSELEVCDIDEKGQLNSEADCSKNSKKKRKINEKEMKDFKDDTELVAMSHEKECVKISKRKKRLSQELIEKEKAAVVRNKESSSEEITIVESSKSKKSRLKRIADSQNLKSSKSIIQDKIVADSTRSDDVNLTDSYVRDKSFGAKKLIDTDESLNRVCIENIKKVNINHKKTEKEQRTDNDNKTDSEDDQSDVTDKNSENGKKKRRRRNRKRKTKVNCLEIANSMAQYPDTSVNYLVPNTKISSDDSRKKIETPNYNFSYKQPRNKKPMAKGTKSQNKHVIFDSDDVILEDSMQKMESIDDNITKESLFSSLWDLSNINIVDNSHYDKSSPSTSTPIIPPLIKVEENSCNEISSTSMQKLILPGRIKKVNSAEENEKTFGALLKMSNNSEEPLISTYAGRKVKEKSNNCTSTVSSATEQHQRRSPPKGAPTATHLPQNDDVANIFHNLLATQNFSQAFICPRTPSVSKLTCVKHTTIQSVISSTGIVSSNESEINAQPKLINSLGNDNGSFLESNIGAVDSLANFDAQEKEESENEMDDMIHFTKVNVEANLAEAKAAMNRRKRARPKAVSSMGSLLNRIRAGGINPKEESESDIEVQSIDIKDNLGQNLTSTIDPILTSTIDPNELENCEFSNDSSVALSNLQTEAENWRKRGEQNDLRLSDKEDGLIPEIVRQIEFNDPENCDIKTVNNTNQKQLMDLNKEPELKQSDEEVNVVEPDLEVKEIKDSDCMIVNALSDKLEFGSPSRKDQPLSGGMQGSKLRQSPRVTRNSIKTVITVTDEEKTVITVKDEDNASTSSIEGSKSYKELGEAYFDQFPVMKVLPKVKEFVAVKLLSLDENCIPVYSNYQQAQVLKVQGTNITFRYIDKLEKLPSKDGRVQVVDLTLEGDGNTETIDWRDVHEPRLIFP